MIDSISKLQMNLDLVEDYNQDKDIETANKWFIVKCWAEDFLKLDKNIQETSLNHSHKIERMEKGLDEIKPI